MRVLVANPQTINKVERVAFAPEGTHLFASGLHDGSLGYGQPDLGIDVFDLAGGSEPVTQLLDDRVVRWFAPLTGGRLAVAQGTTADDSHYDVGVDVFDWRTHRGSRPQPEKWEVWYPCAVGPDGARLIAGLTEHEHNQTVRGRGAVEHGLGCWSLPNTTRFTWRLNLGSDRRILIAAFAPDGRSFWTADAVVARPSPRARIELVPRDADTGNPLREPIAYPNQLITDLALGPSFAIAHHGPTLLAYDLTQLDRKPKKLTNPAKRKHFAGFAIHPSGKWLATAGLDGAVTLWGTANWQVAQTWSWDVGQARSVCFSADGTLAAAGTNTGKIVVWDLDL